MRTELIAIIVALAVIMMLMATRLFGHAELSLFAKRMLHIAGSFLDAPGAGKSHRLEIHFQGNTSWSDLLQVVADQAFELNLTSVRVEVNAPAIQEHYVGHRHWSEEEPDGATFWRADLPVTIDNRMVGRLIVSGLNDAEPLVEKISTIVKLIEEFQTAVCALAKTARNAEPLQEQGAISRPHFASVRGNDQSSPDPLAVLVRKQ